MSTFKINKIFAIVNPTCDNSRLLRRIKRIASQEHSEVIAYCCIYSNQSTDKPEVLQNVETRRYELWLNEIIKPLTESGVKVTLQVGWNPDWREATCKAAAESGCDLTVRATRSSGRLKSFDKRLLREANTPVLMLKRDKPLESGNILAALKLHDPDNAHSQLNDDILRFSKAVVNLIPNCTLHAVTSCTGWEDILDPWDIGKKTGINRTDCHYTEGSPEKGIEEVSNAIDAELVVIGAVPPGNIKGKFLGTTAEHVLAKLDCDIITFIDKE